MKLLTNQEVIGYIQSLENYSGYIQWSHRPIEKDKDIFLDKTPQLSQEDGFIYEAHFCNDHESVTIRQINDGWYVSKTDISGVDKNDTNDFHSEIAQFPYKVRMAQIWEEENDPYCENMPVYRLRKVVFAGFVKGGER